MSDLIVKLWKCSGIYTWNRWQKADDDAVGEADDDIPLQLNWGTIAAKNKGGASFDTGSRLQLDDRPKTKQPLPEPDDDQSNN